MDACLSDTFVWAEGVLPVWALGWISPPRVAEQHGRPSESIEIDQFVSSSHSTRLGAVGRIDLRLGAAIDPVREPRAAGTSKRVRLNSGFFSRPFHRRSTRDTSSGRRSIRSNPTQQHCLYPVRPITGQAISGLSDDAPPKTTRIAQATLARSQMKGGRGSATSILQAFAALGSRPPKPHTTPGRQISGQFRKRHRIRALVVGSTCAGCQRSKLNQRPGLD